MYTFFRIEMKEGLTDILLLFSPCPSGIYQRFLIYLILNAHRDIPVDCTFSIYKPPEEDINHELIFNVKLHLHLLCG